MIIRILVIKIRRHYGGIKGNIRLECILQVCSKYQNRINQARRFD